MFNTTEYKVYEQVVLLLIYFQVTSEGQRGTNKKDMKQDDYLIKQITFII